MKAFTQTEQPESLSDEVSHIESETRMILPGIQALFGFQLIAVFNERFDHVLPLSFQILHWFALGCTAVATIFMIAPAAYHRQAEPHSISQKFTELSTLWITIALFPMILGCVIDFFLIGFIITQNILISVIVSTLLFLLFLVLWYLCPFILKRRK